MEEIWSKSGKWPPKSEKKHCLEKEFAARFCQVKKQYKTNGKPLFEKSTNASEIPYKNQGQMEEIWSKNGKWPPKSLEKQYLEKGSASRFSEVRKHYKTNGKP